MLHIANFKLDDRKLLFEELSFLVIQFENELNRDLVKNFDGIIIQANSLKQSLKIISWFRKNPVREIYLKPLFIARSSEGESLLQSVSDGISDLVYLQNIAQRCRNINPRIKSLPDTNLEEDFISNLSHKLFEFLFSRKKFLAPISSRQSPFSYFYPFINSIVEGADAYKALDVLEKARREGYLTANLKDKIHVCQSCYGNYLNFRETCPKCHSLDTKTEDVIHHFVCAHVAPASDFEKDNYLSCPKCDKELRHIGIDYDKPSKVNTCNHCTHQYQNPDMKAFCIDCNEDQELSQLIEKPIQQYELSSKGETYVLNFRGQQEKKIEDSTTPGMLSLPFFRVLLRQEISRSELRDTGAYYGKIWIKDHIFNNLNEQGKEAIKLEISRIIRNYLPPSDILAAKQHDCYIFILTETASKEAERKTQLVLNNLNKLLGDNLDQENQVVRISYEAIRPGINVDL